MDVAKGEAVVAAGAGERVDKSTLGGDIAVKARWHTRVRGRRSHSDLGKSGP